jgi:hypothetical protein
MGNETDTHVIPSDDFIMTLFTPASFATAINNDNYDIHITFYHYKSGEDYSVQLDPLGDVATLLAPVSETATNLVNSGDHTILVHVPANPNPLYQVLPSGDDTIYPGVDPTA